MKYFLYFPTRKLTQEEEDDCEYTETVYLTPDTSVWDPHDKDYAEREDRSVDFRGYLIEHEHKDC